MDTDDLRQRLAETTRRTIQSAGPRYSPSLDSDAPNIAIDHLLNAVSALTLGDRTRERLRERTAELRTACRRADDTLDDLFKRRRVTTEMLAHDVEQLVALHEPSEIRRIVLRCRRRARLLTSHVREAERTGFDTLSAFDEGHRRVPEHDRERSGLENLLAKLRDVRGAVDELAEIFAGPEGMLLADRQCIMLVGPWGTGKTHFICDLALAAEGEGIPALPVLASSLRNDLQPLDAISAATGVGRDGDDLARLLDREGQAAGCRAIVLIDAINEADRAAWRRHLRPLALQVQQYHHLGLVVTCRTPFNRAIVTTGAAKRFVHLEHRGFEDSEFDAQQQFFTFYGLPAPRVPLLTPEFSRPLFLRLLCEALSRLSRSSQHRQLKGVAEGQKGMTYVLEYFTKKVGAPVEDRHGVSRQSCWRLLKGQPRQGQVGVAGMMAESQRSWVWRGEVEREVAAQTGLGIPAARDFVSDMVADGLLADDMRYIDGQYEEVLVFPYQRFGDHLIARHLLDVHLNTGNEGALRRSFYADTPLGSMFVLDTWGSQYAEPGVASALMLEFPERMKRIDAAAELVHYLPKGRRHVAPFVDAFLDGLYWRSPTSFTNGTWRLLDFLLDLDDEQVTPGVYEVLTTLATLPEHPANSSVLWTHLQAMSMRQRDLAWSEYLRSSDDRSVVGRLLAWVERPGRSAVSASVARNELQLLALLLTTTDRKLRDRTTRALVKIGEAHPAVLFDLVIESLRFNDPYIPERVLGAAYGVAMRGWATARGSSHFAVSLAQLADRLIQDVLRPTAQHSTWHALMRGYAIGIVSVCRLLRPRSIRPDDRALLSPEPSQAPSPFREPRNIRRADLMPAEGAIHMNFGNYTIGRLIEGRQNYDMNHREYRKVRRQIVDRMRRLGYTEDAFGEIDRRVGEASWRGPRESTVDRYGKKYSWIAYFEMYGLRDAQGVLSEWRTGERTSDCDVDPSFPDEVPGWELPTADLFSGAPVDHVDWLVKGPVPDYAGLLERHDVDGRQGPWILLDGFIRERGSAGREAWTILQSVLASSRSAQRMKQELDAGSNFADHGLPELGQDFYTYHGEVPWSERYGREVRTASGRPRRSNDRAVTYFASGRWKAGIPVELACWRWAWESYHGELNQLGSVVFPSPALASYLRLRRLGGSSDLIDPSGRLATLYRTAGSENESHVLYIRSDLLARYLSHRRQRLIRSMWGERGLEFSLLERPLPEELQSAYSARSHRFHCAIGLPENRRSGSAKSGPLAKR